MFILSERKKRIRSLLFVTVLGLALVVGFCLIKTKEAAVDALTSAGERVDVERQKKADGYTYNIYYSSDTAATVRFYVTNQSGQTSIGFCRNPDMRGPDLRGNPESNPLYAKMFAPGYAANITKLMAYLVTVNNPT